MFLENDEYVIIDFKTDKYIKKEKYTEQILSYAYAAEEITGKKVKEKILYFFDVFK